MRQYRVLDLFSAAAGGWSLGLHRAGFKTVAAAEKVAWRRAIYAQNNPGVYLYDDVRRVTAARLRRDLGFLPEVVVGSPPCQDISGANTRGRGVHGSESSLYFDALRVVGETRPRWAAFENSDRIRNRGFDAIADELERLDYAVWAHVVPAEILGANHLRPRSWILACSLEQLGRPREVAHADSGQERVESRWSGWPDRARQALDGNDDSAIGTGSGEGFSAPQGIGTGEAEAALAGNIISLHPGRSINIGRRATASRGRSSTRSNSGKMGSGSGDCEGLSPLWPRWNGGLVRNLRLDDGLSTAVAELRIAVGGPRGTTGARLITEAFGDAVIPQIPEAIGRAIMKVEAVFNG